MLLTGMSVMVLAFGLVVMGCDDGNNNNGGGGGNPFIGIWYGEAPGPCYVTFTVAESAWTQTQTGTVSGSCSGTYTYSGNNALFTATAASGELASYVTVGSPWPATISGSTLIASGVTYTK